MFLVPLSSLPTIQGQETMTGQQQKEGKIPFANVMQQAIQQMQESRQIAAEDSYQMAMGNTSDLHTMMIHSAMETTAVETAVQLTSRVVSAYKEIMQMQI